MNALFYSRNCPHCAALFRTGLVSPAAVRMVCVDSTGIALPPEVHSVPALWVAHSRKVLLGPQVQQYFESATKAKADQTASASASASADPDGCSLGDGGCGAFSSIQDGETTFSTSFLPLDHAYGGGQGPANLPPSQETRGALCREPSQGAEADLDAYKSRRDAELSDILGRQKGPLA